MKAKDKLTMMASVSCYRIIAGLCAAVIMNLVCLHFISDYLDIDLLNSGSPQLSPELMSSLERKWVPYDSYAAIPSFYGTQRLTLSLSLTCSLSMAMIPLPPLLNECPVHRTK